MGNRGSRKHSRRLSLNPETGLVCLGSTVGACIERGHESHFLAPPPFAFSHGAAIEDQTAMACAEEMICMYVQITYRHSYQDAGAENHGKEP